MVPLPPKARPQRSRGGSTCTDPVHGREEFGHEPGIDSGYNVTRCPGTPDFCCDVIESLTITTICRSEQRGHHLSLPTPSAACQSQVPTWQPAIIIFRLHQPSPQHALRGLYQHLPHTLRDLYQRCNQRTLVGQSSDPFNG